MTRPADEPDRTPAVTVVITTKDRREELRRALDSAVRLEGAVEILVIDDGSTDATADMVRTEYPGVRLERFERSAGLIARRNDGARLARAPIIISIDDDAEFTSPDTAGRAAAAFRHPRVGAVALPYVEQGRGETRVRQLAPDEDGLYVTGPYIGTAHALRRDVFERLGGYARSLVRNTEELDYWTRMLDAGYVTCLGTGAPILHHESARRVVADVVFYDCRNNLLHAWRNVPFPYVVVRVAKVLAYMLAVISLRTRQPAAVVRGLASGVLTAARSREERRPVRRSSYRLGHAIRNRGAVPLAEVEPQLPPAT
jgi:glycosyltransferase involved in cell wall biosynthesis